MSPPRSIAVVLEAFSAIEVRDWSRLATLCHPEVSFHWPPPLPYGGVTSGRDAAARDDRGWSAAWQPFQPTPAERRMDPRVVAATASQVVVLWRQRGLSEAGARYDGEVLGLYDLRDGLLARAQMFYFDPVAAANFLRQAPTDASDARRMVMRPRRPGGPAPSALRW
jgi:uncharacterized protein